MSIAEHVTVFISIIVGIAVSDLLTSFHRLLQARDRVRWYWVPLGVALYVLLLTVNYWWLTFTWFSDAERLTVAEFIPTLAQFVVLFLLVAASLPDGIPEAGLDLRAWYFRGARLFWTMATFSLLLAIVVGGARETTTGGSLVDAIRAESLSLVMLPPLVAMVFVRQAWFHAAFIILSLATMAWVTVSIALS